MKSKICNKCNLDKNVLLFNKNKTKSDGYQSICKECTKLLQRDYYQRNKETILSKVKNYAENNKDIIKANQKEYYQLKKDILNVKNKEYQKENKETIKIYIDKYRIENRDKINTSNAEYRKNNKDKIKEAYKKSKNNRLKNDSLFRLRESISNNIRCSFKRSNHIKNSKTQDILGCTFNEFKLYLESKFEDWMTWDNYGNPKDGMYEPNKTWDLDHVIPISISVTEGDVIRLNHYTNFQPLCSYYNRNIKKDNY